MYFTNCKFRWSYPHNLLMSAYCLQYHTHLQHASLRGRTHGNCCTVFSVASIGWCPIWRAYRNHACSCVPEEVPLICKAGSSRAEFLKRIVAGFHKALLQIKDNGEQRSWLFWAQLTLPGASDWLKCAPAPDPHTYLHSRTRQSCDTLDMPCWRVLFLI